MTLTPNNFNLFAGDTSILEVTVVDAAGDAVNLSGKTIKWQLFKSKLSGSPVFSKDTGDGITIVDAANGRCDVRIEPSDTEDVAAGLYYHEAKLTDGTDVNTILLGTITLVKTSVRFT